ncbi:hypothetical protein CEXT_634191 [Caerostris extrusa]|uniref:Uncharacterized protein n=1 Tax=Caerostris extrusa TaxID=172846 RepID=A0AAV4RE28_CAEEX|nr:hypothetical protein CEXT_634191 [Caerostris extrusa]
MDTQRHTFIETVIMEWKLSSSLTGQFSTPNYGHGETLKQQRLAIQNNRLDLFGSYVILLQDNARLPFHSGDSKSHPVLQSGRNESSSAKSLTLSPITFLYLKRFLDG